MSDIEKGTKICAYCAKRRPLLEFKRRTGKRSSAGSRRGACKACREAQRKQERPAADAASLSPLAANPGFEAADTAAESSPSKKKRKRRRHAKSQAAKTKPTVQDREAAAAVKKRLLHPHIPVRELKAIGLVPNRKGTIHMRGKTDNGRKWHQEIDPQLALTLVKEHAAVVVNRHMIRRLYSNKEFRHLILERDHYTCRFCGQYGNTIDHMLPRAKGGHTTPDNCVCACQLCNQSKADRDLDAFMKEGR